jgi:hypothetical protein
MLDKKEKDDTILDTFIIRSLFGNQRNARRRHFFCTCLYFQSHRYLFIIIGEFSEYLRLKEIISGRLEIFFQVIIFQKKFFFLH